MISSKIVTVVLAVLVATVLFAQTDAQADFFNCAINCRQACDVRIKLCNTLITAY